MNENENPRITDAERPKKYKHSEISGAFNPLQPTETWSIAGRYSDLSAQWEAGVEVFGASIQKSIAGAWEGTAAESAKDAITRYTKAAQDLTTPLTNLSTRVWDAAQAIVDTNGNLPDPVQEKPWWHKDSWPWVGTNRDSVIEDRQEEAQAVMKDYYVDRFVRLDGQIPAFPQPVDPTKPLDISGPTIDDGGANPRIGSGGGGSSSGGDSPQVSDTGEQPGAEPTSNDETTPSATDSSATQTTPSTVTPSTTQTDPSKLVTNSSTTPASTMSSGTPTGTLGTPGTGTPNSGTGSPGRTVSGTPAGATPAATTAATAAAASRGATGMSGMGGMGAGRGQSDGKESDHKIPDYLINMTNTDELLGEAPKTVPGGVIGDNPDD